MIQIFFSMLLLDSELLNEELFSALLLAFSHVGTDRV